MSGTVTPGAPVVGGVKHEEYDRETLLKILGGGFGGFFVSDFDFGNAKYDFDFVGGWDWVLLYTSEGVSRIEMDFRRT